jgi:hypothetical protein
MLETHCVVVDGARAQVATARVRRSAKRLTPPTLRTHTGEDVVGKIFQLREIVAASA